MVAMLKTHAQDVCPDPVVDDSHVNITSVPDVAAVRGSLIHYIWGSATLPTDSNVTLISNVASPITCSVGLARVDELTTVLGPTISGRTMPAHAYHFVPTNPNHRLAIVHDGHMPENNCTTPFLDPEDGFSAYGLQMTINALLAEGFDVLAVMMPLFQPDDCSQDHNALFDDAGNAPATSVGGSPMRYFFDATLRSLNFLSQQQTFSDVSMMGLSGGGWTTTVYAAVDPRITTSFPVAGSLPLSMRNAMQDGADRNRPRRFAMGVDIHAALRSAVGVVPTVAACGEFGDREGSLPAFYQIAGYPDLYVLGAYGAGRTVVQVLNREDSCCFGENQHVDPDAYDSDIRGYEKEVRATLRALGAGEFRVEIDEAATEHMISRNTVHNVILGELDGAHHGVGARSPTQAFKRGYTGTLWQYTSHGWRDLAFPMIGTPAVLENALHATDVFARSDMNTPLHIFFDGTQWQSDTLVADNGSDEDLPDGRIITDPVAMATSAGQIQVVAFGNDFQAYRWTLGNGTQTFDGADGNGLAVGSPAITLTPNGSAGIYYRSAVPAPDASTCIEQPRVLYQLVAGGYQQWQPEQRIGGAMAGYPSASSDQASISVYSIGMDGKLSQATSVDAMVWQRPLPTGISNLQFTGRPSSPPPHDAAVLFARGTDSDLLRLLYDGEWTATPLGLAQNNANALTLNSPVAVDGGVYWIGRDRQVWFYDGTQSRQLPDDRIWVDGFDG